MDALDTALDAAFSSASPGDAADVTPVGDSDAVEIDATPAAEAAPPGGDPPVVDAAEPGDVELINAESEGEPIDAATEDAPPAKPGKVDPNLPEGVSIEPGKDGKKRWVLDPARGAKFHAGYKQVQAIQQKLGLDALDEVRLNLMVDDHQAFNDLDDWIQGDAASQEKVFRFWLGRGPKAMQAGVVNYNPHDHTASAFLSAAEKGAPKVYQAIQSKFVEQAKSDVVEQAYTRAKQLGLDTREGKNALGTAQRLDQLLFNKFREPGDVLKPKPVEDPSIARMKEVEQREATLDQRDKAAATENWNQWVESVTNDRVSTRAEIIAEVLKPFAKTYAKFPEMRKTLEIRLDHEINEAFAKDQNWGPKVRPLYQKAKTAGSEQYRGGLREQLRREYAAGARKVMSQDGARIINDSTQAIVGGSQDTHKRLANGQSQQAGTQTGGPARVPIAKPNGKIPMDKLDAEIDKIFAAAGS